MKLLKNTFAILAIIVLLLFLNSTNIFAKTVVVDTDTLKLRKEASTDSTTLELLNKGQELEYIEETGDWYKVKVDGMTGFVHKDYAKIKDAQETTNTTNTNSEKTNTISNNEISNTVTNTVKNNDTVNNVENTVTDTSNADKSNQIAINEQIKISKDCNGYILPLINSNVIENIKKDNTVTVISKTNKWLYVETQDANVWLRSENVIETVEASNNNTVEDNKSNTNTETNSNTEENSNTNTDVEISSKIMYVNSSSIYVRKGPGTDYEIIDSLILNSGVTVIAENGDWYKVNIEGKTGYIAKRLLSASATQTTSRGDNVRENVQTTSSNTNANISKGEEAVEYAKTYLGCKYVYGASGPSTFDCSGFTMFVFKKYGVTLSHSATAQSKVGTYVAKEDLQPGDLVFFTDYETGNGIGHCGIYIGDGNFIHASSGTGYCVKISTLTSGSYYNRYETARRVL